MRALTWGVAVLAFFVWRNGRMFKHAVLTLPPFPAGYYASGEHSTDCIPLAPSGDPDFKFCEDATFWDIHGSDGRIHTRHVLLSCDANRKSWNTVMGPLRDPNPKGSLWIYTPSPGAPGNPQPRRVTLQNYPENHDFHPLGLEISASRAGDSSNLFVINHARERTTIEQFTVLPDSPTTITYVRTLSSPYFISPNSLALTSPTSFYVTNDHLFTRRLPWPIGNILPVVESLLALPLGWVVHVSLLPSPSGPSSEPIFSQAFVAHGIPFANGVTLSPDGSTVAVASSSSGQVYLYAREATNNTLTHKHTIPTPFMPDNLQYDDSGALIVSGHAHFPSLVKVAANKTDAVAPSWILSISPRAGASKSSSKSIFAPVQAYDLQTPISASLRAPAMASHEVETLFQSNGTGFSSSATGLRDARTGALYISGLYAERGAIVCRPAQ